MRPFIIVLIAMTFFPSGSTLAATFVDARGSTAFTWPWALPLIGILLTIATGPLLFPKFWHHHYGKLAIGWSAATLLPMAMLYGTPVALSALVHAMLGEYLSFIALIFALYVVAGGLLLTGNLRGTPIVNTALLTFGTLIASIVGTTGAAMILIRPLLRANRHRASSAHVVVFFIFLVCNIGGALSPLGDPPLFIGFLRGVDFFWPLRHLWLQTIFVAGLVLAAFIVIDTLLWRRENHIPDNRADFFDLKLHGLMNLPLVVLIVATILISAIWQPGILFDVYGTSVALQNLVRDAVMVLIALLSLWWTPNEHRKANGFSFAPFWEVAILFAAIFICIVSVLTMLQAASDGPFAILLSTINTADGQPRNAMYFWLTGALSGLLDNAPTYLVFFQLAGGRADQLMTNLAPTLAAISMGAVYMGALTYVGNAPNFMVYAIATESGVRMPSFFGYLLWSMTILVPIFLLLSLFGI